jgi:hypothetical protein
MKTFNLFPEIPQEQYKREYEAKCKQCGNDLDLLSAFTIYNVCSKCCKKNHKAALNGNK